MRYTKFNIKVLVAPLDWGLGHATRCIPIIRQLLLHGCEVLIATSGPQEQLLRAEFPTLSFISLPGYKVRYAKRFLMWRLIGQVSGIKKSIAREHAWLQEVVRQHGINWVISDNRYGLWHEQVPCTFITHQLRVRLPFFCRWAEPLVQKVLYTYINRFTNCWVPDLPDAARGLSGLLGHPANKPQIPIRYLGWLSRFGNEAADSPTRYKYMVSLSGPEPQRSLLEGLLVKQMANEKKKVLLVRGLPGNQSGLALPANIEVYAHLPSDAMRQAFMQAGYIVCRSGYSTLMDAFTLQKKCILIPTPGQTEQEYLGKRLGQQRMALVYPQHAFQLQEALQEAEGFAFHFPLNSMNDLLGLAVDAFLQTHFLAYRE